MSREIEQSEATAAHRRVYFHCVDATDGLTPETSEAGGQPQISTNGAAWTNTGIGVLVAIGNGRYYGELTQGAVGTVDDVIETRYKSANTAETPGDQIHVIAPRALASVCTETRLAELDAANMPADIDAIPTTAMRGTDNAATAASIGTPVALDGGSADIAGMITKLADDNGGADYDAGTDSQAKLADAAGVAGAGLPTLTVTLLDTDGNGDPIPGARVQIFDSGNTTYINEGTTDATGAAAIIIPTGDGSYKIRSYLAGWTFTVPESATVSGDSAAEKYGVEFTAGTPSPGTVRIYSWEFESDGATAVAAVDVYAWPSNQGEHHDDGGIAYEDYKVTATTDGNGYWYMDLTPAIQYDFDLRNTRGKVYRTITTPAATAQLEDIPGLDD